VLVNELITLLMQEDPNKEVRIKIELFCGKGGCDCTSGTYDYDDIVVDTVEHDFIVIS
jgi:hypothetical protein